MTIDEAVSWMKERNHISWAIWKLCEFFPSDQVWKVVRELNEEKLA